MYIKKFLFVLGCITLFYCTAHAQEIARPESTVFPEQEPKRYLGMVEMGYLLGKGTFGSGSLQATSSVVIFNGYQVKQALALGLSLGLSAYEESTITPISLGLRGSLGTKRVRPFYSLDVGYGTAFLNGDREQVTHRGGWLFNPSAGILVSAGNQTAFTFGAGYSQQRAIYEFTSWNGGRSTKNEYSFKRLSLRMGFQF